LFMVHMSGSRHSAYNIVLKGQPCLTELRIDMGAVQKLFIWIADVAVLYIVLITCLMLSGKAYGFSTSNKYSWFMLP
jgi:hypothetical protein